MKDSFCMIHEEQNSEKSYAEWNRIMGTMASRMNDHFTASEKVQLEDEDYEEDAASNESPSFGHVVNMYQCLNVSQKKTTTEKEPQKQNSRYNLRIQGAPTVIEILKDKFKQVLRILDAPTSLTQKTQRKFGKTTTTKET